MRLARRSRLASAGTAVDRMDGLTFEPDGRRLGRKRNEFAGSPNDQSGAAWLRGSDQWGRAWIAGVMVRPTDVNCRGKREAEFCRRRSGRFWRRRADGGEQKQGLAACKNAAVRSPGMIVLRSALAAMIAAGDAKRIAENVERWRRRRVGPGREGCLQHKHKRRDKRNRRSVPVPEMLQAPPPTVAIACPLPRWNGSCRGSNA